MRVVIPMSKTSRKEKTYACLLRHVSDNPTAFAFDGKFFPCGKVIDESELWPGDDWPATPILLEHAGPDACAPLARRASGFGHRRRPHVHVLWRYERETHAWRQLARTSSVDNAWVEHFAAIARLELKRQPGAPPPAEVAARVSARVVETLEKELLLLGSAEKTLALGFVYEDIVARVSALEAA